jgi:hypothetical protein
MKLRRLINEDTLESVLVKILNLLLKKGADPEDVSDNFRMIQKDFLIDDTELASEAILYYRKYYEIASENGTFRDLGDVSLDYDEEEIDGEILALAEHLAIHPFLIEKDNYGYYKEVIDDEEYRVLEENEAQTEFEERAEDYIDEWLANTDDLGWLEHHLELQHYAVEQFADEEARYRVEENMSNEEIIEEWGVEEQLESMMVEARKNHERWEELDNTIVDIQYDIEELERDLEEISTELTDNMTEQSRSSDRSEVADLQNEYKGLLQKQKETKEKLEYWVEEIEELQFEFDELDKTDWESAEYDAESKLADEVKEELMEQISGEIYKEIENEGIDYFTQNLGYDAKSAADNFFKIDYDAATKDLEMDGRGNIMSSYDGEEYEEFVGDTTYYIYRYN